MKNVRKRLGLIVAAGGLSLLSTVANAASVSGPIAMLYPLADGTYVLGFNSPISVCSASGGIRYVFITVGQNGLSAEGAKHIIATALMAYSSDRPVTVTYSDASSACYVNNMTVP